MTSLTMFLNNYTRNTAAATAAAAIILKFKDLLPLSSLLRQSVCPLAPPLLCFGYFSLSLSRLAFLAPS